MNASQITQRKPSPHLLDTIKAIRTGVGDGLNDNELTHLLRETTLLSEAGFGFLSFSDGLVTLTVPEQDLTSWYPAKGWIAPEKETIATAIAEKYGLSLHEPSDTTTSFWHSSDNPPAAHHHLELSNRWQTVVVAHPQYLKVRLYGMSSDQRYASDSRSPLPLGADLLQDLAALYSNRTELDPPPI